MKYKNPLALRIQTARTRIALEQLACAPGGWRKAIELIMSDNFDWRL